MGVEQNLSFLKQAKRKLVSSVVPIVVRQEINHVNPDGLNQANQLVKQGYGLIVAFTHFSQRDAFDIMSFIIKQPTLGKRPIVSPIARHQYDYHPSAKVISKFVDIELHPIITEDTKRYEKIKDRYKDRLLNEGLIDYIKAGAKALGKGAIVPIALQAGRRATLYEEEPTFALSSIMKAASIYKIYRYGVLFVGLELPGVENYKDVDGYNLFRKFRLNVGSLYTALEILNQMGKKGHEIDIWAYEKQLEPLVSKSYRVRKTPTPIPSSPGV